MKFSLLSLAFFTCFSLWGTPQFSSSIRQDEIKTLTHLIETTQSHLKQQEQIKNTLLEYREKRALFIKQDENKQVACELLALASELSNLIEKSTLHEYFCDEFLEELTFFSQIADKKNQVTAP